MTDTTYRRPITWVSAALTDVGKVRSVNEDAILVKPELHLWAVADGMGGHKVGDVASTKIVEALNALTEHSKLSECVDIIDECLEQVNRQLLEYSQIMFEGSVMGSTVVIMVIRGRIGACLWVGDSRLYRFRNNRLTQLTRDHSQVEDMIDSGEITREESETHPNKNVITRAVGVEDQLNVDVTLFTVQVGDSYLLCSDGLFNAVNVDDLTTLMAIRDVDQCSSLLLAKALDNGAKDNVSVVVVRGNPGPV